MPATPQSDLTRVVFDRFPYGLLVVEAGVVLAANDEAARILGREDLEGQSCCALLGCAQADGPLAGGCVAERALAEARTLPEVRVDLDAGDGLRAVWVTGSPLSVDRALLHLRPGRAGDRRRRADAGWSAGPELHVHVLGRTRLGTAEGPLDGPWLRQRPGQLLKLLLANRRRMTHTDELLTAFWPGDHRRGLQSVRFAVHDLRGRLEPGRAARQPSSFVVGQDGGYGLDLDRVRVDADDFERHARLGIAAAADGDTAAARRALARAADLYQGDFLADEPYAEWAIAERDRLHALAVRVLETLADAALADGMPDAATEPLQRLARIAPLDEAIQRRLIAHLIAVGRGGEALRRYRQAQGAWQSAFGEELGFDLASLRGGDARAA